MAKYIFLVAVCFFLTFANIQGLQTVNGRIKITVGTTSGCGDTVRFMANLVNVYNLYGNFLDIEFIPWGRTVRNDDGSLVCQFGAGDCWANRHHRCSLNMLQGNQTAQMNYMNCEFNSPYPSFLAQSYMCSQIVGLNMDDVARCVNNDNNDDLDLEAERRGSELTASINFIPSIVFNDEIDLDLHRQALTRLESMVCFALAADPTTGVAGCTL